MYLNFRVITFDVYDKAQSFIESTKVPSLYAGTCKKLNWLIWTLTIFLLTSAGITYRVLASHLKLIIDKHVMLPIPLSKFPLQVGDWAGKELSIPNITKEYMESHFADDFLSRRYFNSITKAWADVYIVYCSSKPAGILGHRPQICYPAHGWIHDGTERSQFTSQNTQQMPCLLQRFHKPAPGYEQVVVLSFYILNGRITTNEDDFSNLFGRRPNIAGDPAYYVAQVQISSVLENSVHSITKSITDLIMDFLPDMNGNIKAFTNINNSSNSLK